MVHLDQDRVPLSHHGDWRDLGKIVFGQYLFAPAFFWEDVFSFAVIGLHTAYVWALFGSALEPVSLMLLALLAYAAYVINAGQFLLKLRAARLQAGATA